LQEHIKTHQAKNTTSSLYVNAYTAIDSFTPHINTNEPHLAKDSAATPYIKMNAVKVDFVTF